jgi:hypothetical protein
VTPDYGYSIVYTVDKKQLPLFVTLNDDMSVTLPSKFDFTQPQGFYLTYQCGIPQFSSVEALEFIAFVLLMPKPECTGDCSGGGGGDGKKDKGTHIYGLDIEGYWMDDTYFFFDF